MQHARRSAALIGTAAVVLAAAVPPATAETYRVSGEQIVEDPSTGQGRVTGGLLGDFDLVNAKDLASKPLIRARGRESFQGCIDRGLDGSCQGDPTGTLRFRFLYWAQAGQTPDALVWGSCWHPVTGGTGDFRGARGVLTMVDSPQPDGTVRTDYIGTITTAGGAGRATVAGGGGCVPAR
jgi:hypothetical protein